MARYRFRLRFRFEEHDTLNFDGSTLTLEAGEGKLQLKSPGGETPLRHAEWLVLTGGPFATEEDAHRAADKAEAALLIYSLHARTGIDLGRSRPGGVLTTAGKAYFEERTGAPVLADRAGVTVYEDVAGTVFLGFSADCGVGHSAETFLNRFSESYLAVKVPSAKQKLALELYAASRFDTSPRSRFVTLVISVEALLDAKPRPPEAQLVISHLIKAVGESGLSRDQVDSISASLTNLRNESIGRAGRSLARRLLARKKFAGKEAEDFFTQIYRLRSQLVHTGHFTAEPHDALRQLANDTDSFVADLLTASLSE